MAHAFNAAKQETILTNIMPRITALLQNTWLTHLQRFGSLDWNEPVEAVAGNTTSQQINARLLDYFAVKGQEGRPQSEQRKWRMNAVARYTSAVKDASGDAPSAERSAGRTDTRKATV